MCRRYHNRSPHPNSTAQQRTKGRVRSENLAQRADAAELQSVHAQPLLTLGHGTASEDELVALIREAELEAIVDVRTIPKSRRHSHVWQEAVERWAAQRCGISYRWEPSLGGFRTLQRNSSNVALRHPAFRAYADYMETDAFAQALVAVLSSASRALTAIFCSETVWWRCHRRLVSDAAVLLYGVEVRHLMHDGNLRPHRVTPGVRVTAERKLRYDVLFEQQPEPDDASQPISNATR